MTAGGWRSLGQGGNIFKELSETQSCLESSEGQAHLLSLSLGSCASKKVTDSTSTPEQLSLIIEIPQINNPAKPIPVHLFV